MDRFAALAKTTSAGNTCPARCSLVGAGNGRRGRLCERSEAIHLSAILAAGLDRHDDDPPREDRCGPHHARALSPRNSR